MNFSDAKDGSKFSLLSLDGGGIKGIFSAAVLAALEEDLNIKIADHFDLIAGTSTGGIIAIGLGLGLTPRQILNFYLDNAAKIFPSSNRRWFRGWLGVKYSNEPLIKSLKDIFGNKTFGCSTKRLIIPSYSLTSDEVYNFRTAHHVRLRRDYKIPAWQVAAATSAAPTYFPAFREINNSRLVDGGVWANNPLMLGIVEAITALDADRSQMRAFSIGTTYSKNAYQDHFNTAGKLRWVSKMTNLFMTGQKHASLNHAQLLLGKDNLSRVDFIVPGHELALDSIGGREILFAAAHEEVRKISPEFKERFVSRKVDEFLPIY